MLTSLLRKWRTIDLHRISPSYRSQKNRYQRAKATGVEARLGTYVSRGGNVEVPPGGDGSRDGMIKSAKRQVVTRRD